MKQKNITPEKENIRSNGKTHRPEIRDNLDSRVNEEQRFKGDDVTHNKKEKHKSGKGKN